MLKEILRGLSSFFTSEKVLILVVFLVLVLVISMYSGNKIASLDTMSNYESESSFSPNNEFSNNELSSSSVYSNEAAALPSEQPLRPMLPQVDSAPSYEVTSSPSMAPPSASSEVANPSDLLPNDQNSQWAALNPVNSGNIAMPDLLQAGYHIGLDTIGQTLRNANLQLRSDPIIPKSAVGPWMQSTIEPDYGRVPLEIGSAQR